MPTTQNFLEFQHKTQTIDSTAMRVDWAHLLREEIIQPDVSNNIRITYTGAIGNTVIHSGYLTWEYTKETTADPQIRLLHQYVLGKPHDLEWIISLDQPNYLDLMVHVNLETDDTDYTLYYNVESEVTVDVVYEDALWNHELPTTVIYAGVTYNTMDGWSINGGGDLYNINPSGRVGINTGIVPVSSAMLEVNGEQLLRGALQLQRGNSARVLIDSDTSNGHELRVYNMKANVTRLHMDNSGQLGINTNSPLSRLHVVGNTIISESTSIGTGNSPRARVDINGIGTTDQTFALKVHDSANKLLFYVRDDGEISGMATAGDPVVDFYGDGVDQLTIELESGITFDADVAVLGSDGKVDPSVVPDTYWESAGGDEITPVNSPMYVNLGEGWGFYGDDSGYATSFGQAIGENSPDNSPTVDWDDDNQVVSAKAIAQHTFGDLKLDDLTDVDAIGAGFQGEKTAEHTFDIASYEGSVVSFFYSGDLIQLLDENDLAHNRIVDTVQYLYPELMTRIGMVTTGTPIPDGVRIIVSQRKTEEKAFLMFRDDEWEPRTVTLRDTVKDVKLDIPSLRIGQILTYDGTFWTNNVDGGYLSKVHDDRAAGSIGIKVDPDPDIALSVGGYLTLETGAKVNEIKSDPTDTPTTPSEETLLTESMIWPHIVKKEAGVNGILTWGEPGIGKIDDTHFRVYAGTGRIYPAYNNPTNFLSNEFAWLEEQIELPKIGSSFGVVHVFADEGGVIHARSTPPSDYEARICVSLGYVVFESNAISDIYPSPNVTDSTGTILNDYFRFLHDDHQLSGALVVHKGTDLAIYTEFGEFFHPGIRHFFNNKKPNILPIPANGSKDTTPTAPAAKYTFVDTRGTTTAGPDVMPKKYDDAVTGIKDLTGDGATIHLIYIVPGGSQYMLYGQHMYTDKDAAEKALEDHIYSVSVPEGLQNAIFLAYVLVDANGYIKVYNRSTDVVGSSPGGGGEIIDGGPPSTITGWSSTYIDSIIHWKTADYDDSIIQPRSENDAVHIGTEDITDPDNVTFRVGGEAKITGTLILETLPPAVNREYIVRSAGNKL